MPKLYENHSKVDLEDLYSRDRIVRSNQGGPVRTVLNGRHTKATGTFISAKAGFRSLVWESKKAELQCMRICEASPNVFSMMSQPHRFEFYVSRLRRPLVYFPDLELSVSPYLVHQLRRGTPFGQAAMKVRVGNVRPSKRRKLVIEIKDRDDPRLADPFYNEKIRLAEIRYHEIGYEFVVLHRKRDIDCAELPSIHQVVLDNRTNVSRSDARTVRAHLESLGGRGRYDTVSACLGVGPVGKAKLHALHVRQVVCLDLGRPLQPSSDVHLMSY